MTARRRICRCLGQVLLTFGILIVDAAAATLDELRERGSIAIGFANEAPFGFATQDGKATGEAPEIAKVVFRRMGIDRIDAVLTEWASLIPGLRADRFDVIAAGMFVTPARCKQVNFSRPTYRLGQGLLVRAGNPKGLHSYADIAKDRSVRLAIMAGAVERGYARRAGVADTQISILPDQVSMLAAVRGGRVDAAALTALSVRRMAKRGGDRVEQADPFRTPAYAYGYGAFAFRKEDNALRQSFDRELARFIGTEAHLDLIREFGFDERNLPGAVSVDTLCGDQ